MIFGRPAIVVLAASSLFAALAHARPPPQAARYGARPPTSVLCDPSAWPLEVDGGLCDAARSLAVSLAGHEGETDAPNLARRIDFFLRRHGVTEAQVQTTVVRDRRYGVVIHEMERTARNADAANTLGAGLWPDGDHVIGVLVMARRLLRSDSFPRRLTPGQTLRVAGRFSSGATNPQAFVTLPDGSVKRLELTRRGERFTLRTVLESVGTATIEVLIDVGHGPEVALIAPIHVGVEPPESPSPALVESSRDLASQIVDAFADFRRQSGLPVPERDPRLELVAQERADEMADEQRVVHKPASGNDVEKRLADAGYGFAWVAEDLAVGPGGLVAFQGLLDSPAHREALLSPRARRFGIGIRRRDQDVYLAVLLAEPVAGLAVTNLAAARVVASQLVLVADDAIQRARKKAGLPGSLRDPDLDAVAERYADRLAEIDRARDDAAFQKLRRDLFATDPTLNGLEVDVVVAGHPEAAARAPQATTRGCRRFGLGLKRATSRRFGGERLWIVLMCARSR